MTDIANNQTIILDASTKLIAARNRIIELEAKHADVVTQATEQSRKMQLMEQELANVKTSMRYYQTKLEEARGIEESREVVLQYLLADVNEVSTDDVDMSERDTDGLWQRLKQLVRDDARANEYWSLEQEYKVRMTYTITVVGSVFGTSEADAEERARGFGVDFRLAPSELNDAIIDEVEVEDVDADLY